MPNAKALGKLIFDTGFGVLPPGDSYLSEGGIRFLRATDLDTEDRIRWEDCYRAPAEFSRHDRARIKTGDVLLAVKGATIASEKSVCIVNEVSEPTIINGSVFRFQVTPESSAAFLREVLTADFMRKQMKGALILNNAVDYLSKENIDALLLPLPPLPKQCELVSAMESARTARRTKLAEADALLISLDRYLLDILKITLPPPDVRRVFAIRLGTVRESRFDPDFFHPERILTVRGMESVAGRLWCPSLREAVTFQRDQITEPGENYLSLAHVQSHTGELVSANEEAAGTCFTFQRDDVLFGRLRPYLNKVHRAERPGCCSPEFHVLRVKPGTVLLPEYLATILRSSLILAQTRHMMTGNTHPRLANDDVVNLIIPVPDIATQTTIAAEVRRRREAARALRTKAEADWSEAKRWFEEQLLGKP